MDAPFYVVFAGVNGAGKSTLYQSGLWQLPGMPSTMERVNPDEILREQGGDWRSSSDQLRAGREARKRINELFEKRQSFNQETTLTGRLAARNIKHARQQGYRVLVNYVGVQDAAIALERIAHRVAQGGHDIDESAVRRRFRQYRGLQDACLLERRHAGVVGWPESLYSVAERRHLGRGALAHSLRSPLRR